MQTASASIAPIPFDSAGVVVPLLGAMAACAVALPFFGFSPEPAPALAAAFIGAALCFTAQEILRRGATSIAVLFIAGLAFYHIIIPVEYLIDPNLPADIVYYYPFLSRQTIVGPLIATDLALAGFLVGYALRRSQPAVEPAGSVAFEGSFDEKRAFLACGVLFAIGLALYLTMSYVATGSFTKIFNTTYRERDELFYGLGALGFGGDVATLALTCASVMLLKRGGFARTLVVIGLMAIMVLYGFLVGSKSRSFFPIAGTLVGAYVARRRLPPLTLLSLGIFLLVPILFINLARNKQGEGLAEMASFTREEAQAQDFNPANNDAPGPYLTLIETVSTLRVPEQLRYGETYLKMVTMLPPRFIIANRGDSIEEEFSKTFLGKDYYDNAGFGFSGVAEAYLNFGYPGTFFVFMVVGLGFAVLRDKLDRARGTLPAALLVAASAPHIVLALRLSSPGLTKSYLVMTLLPTLLVILSGRRRAPT